MASLAREEHDRNGPVRASAVSYAAALCARGQATALRCNAFALIEGIGRLGTVTASTCNAFARVESKGAYRRALFDESGIGVAAGDGIEVRLLVDAWRYAFAVEEPRGSTTRRSIEIFGRDGSALHTIEAGPDTDLRQYRRLVDAFGKPTLREVVDPVVTDIANRDTARVDTVQFARAVAAMRDPSDFAALLRRFGLRRERGLRLAGRPFATPLARATYRTILEDVYRSGVAARVLVASRGVVQAIATDVSLCIVTSRVAAPDVVVPRSVAARLRSSLEVRDHGIARTWLVRKPSPDREATDIECFDADGELVLLVTSEPGAGAGEWRALTERAMQRSGNDHG